MFPAITLLGCAPTLQTAPVPVENREMSFEDERNRAMATPDSGGEPDVRLQLSPTAVAGLITHGVWSSGALTTTLPLNGGNADLELSLIGTTVGALQDARHKSACASCVFVSLQMRGDIHAAGENSRQGKVDASLDLHVQLVPEQRGSKWILRGMPRGIDTTRPRPPNVRFEVSEGWEEQQLLAQPMVETWLLDRFEGKELFSFTLGDTGPVLDRVEARVEGVELWVEAHTSLVDAGALPGSTDPVTAGNFAISIAPETAVAFATWSAFERRPSPREPVVLLTRFSAGDPAELDLRVWTPAGPNGVRSPEDYAVPVRPSVSNYGIHLTPIHPDGQPPPGSSYARESGVLSAVAEALHAMHPEVLDKTGPWVPPPNVKEELLRVDVHPSSIRATGEILFPTLQTQAIPNW